MAKKGPPPKPPKPPSSKPKKAIGKHTARVLNSRKPIPPSRKAKEKSLSNLKPVVTKSMPKPTKPIVGKHTAKVAKPPPKPPSNGRGR